MAEMSKAFKPKYMGEKNPSEKILKLARKVTDCIDHKIKGVTADDPEYWGLRCIMTDEMADVALTMKVRQQSPRYVRRIFSALTEGTPDMSDIFGTGSDEE